MRNSVFLAMIGGLVMAGCATAPVTSGPAPRQQTAPPAPAAPAVPQPTILSLLIGEDLASDSTAIMGIVSGTREHCGLDWQQGFVAYIQEAQRLGLPAGPVADDHGFYAAQTKAQLAQADYQCSTADTDELQGIRVNVVVPEAARAPAEPELPAPPSRKPAPAAETPEPETAPTTILQALIPADLADDREAVMGIVSGVRQYCGLDWETGYRGFLERTAARDGDVEAAALGHDFYLEQAITRLADADYTCAQADIDQLNSLGF